MKKRLTRSSENKKLAGVLGGLAEYFDVDPVLVRLFYVLATVFSGIIPGILGYILAVIIVPPAPEHVSAHDVSHNDTTPV